MSKSPNNRHRTNTTKNLSDDDRALFRDQTSDATAYPDAHEPPAKPKRTANKKQQVRSLNNDPDTPIDPWPQGKGTQPALMAADSIDWSRHGLSTRAKQSLRKKTISHTQQCDLHGLTIHEASIKVDSFFNACIRKRLAFCYDHPRQRIGTNTGAEKLATAFFTIHPWRASDCFRPHKIRRHGRCNGTTDNKE